MENVGGPYMRNYHSAKTAGMIEPGIEPLTDALNAVGVPLSSCEGHANKRQGKAFQWLTGLLPIDAYKPFVMFGAQRIRKVYSAALRPNHRIALLLDH